MGKKMLAILLTVVIIFSIAACGQNNTQINSNQPTTPSFEIESPPNEEPTFEEQQMIEECSQIINILNEYAETGFLERLSAAMKTIDDDLWSTYNWYLKYYYERLNALSDVDKWADSEWVKMNNLSCNCQEILSNFIIIEDVFTHTTTESTDAFGQPKEIPLHHNIGIEYDEYGRMIYGRYGTSYEYIYRSHSRYTGFEDHHCNPRDTIYTYNEDGSIAKIIIGDYLWGKIDTIWFQMTPVYNATGEVATMNILYSDGREGVIEYTYDEQNRLISVYSKMNQQYVPTDYLWTYTYDASGNMTSETMQNLSYKNRTETIVYTYDANGRVLTGEIESKGIKCTYNYDVNDRLISCTGSINNYNGLTNFTINYNYGNYYIYKPQ